MSRETFHFAGAVSLIGAVAALVINLQPFFIGAAANSFGFTEVELGYLGSLPTIGSVVVFLSAALWIDRFSARQILFGGSCVAALGLISTLASSSLGSVIGSFMLYSAGVGIIQVGVMTLLGRAADPESAYGAYTGLMVVLAGILAFAIPAYIEPSFGYHGLIWVLLIGTLAAMIFIRLVPQSMSLTVQDAVSPGNRRLGRGLIMIGLFALSLYYAALTGAWAFMERLGVEAGFSGNAIGVTFASSLLISGIGAFAAAYFGERLSAAAAVVITIGLLLIFILLTQSSELAHARYAVAVIAFNTAWAFSVPYLWAILAKTDPTGRVMAFVPIFIGIGGALGPMLAGFLLSASTMAVLSIAFGILAAIAFALFLWVDAKTRHAHSSVTASEPSPA